MFVLYALLYVIKKGENTVPVWKDAEYYLKDGKQFVFSKQKIDFVNFC